MQVRESAVFLPSDLLELHRRTHLSLERMLGHCEGFTQAELTRSLEGFGYPTLLLQLHHLVGAERYWVGVLQGMILTDEHEVDHASLAAVRAYRDRVVAATQAWLEGATPEELARPRAVTTWNGKTPVVRPVHVLLRTQTHVFQHLGQVTAMCRLLARPVPPGFDYPLTERI